MYSCDAIVTTLIYIREPVGHNKNTEYMMYDALLFCSALCVGVSKALTVHIITMYIMNAGNYSTGGACDSKYYAPPSLL